MTYKTIVFIIILIWGLPAMQLRSQFRKMVYQTDDWKINIKPLFTKELKALFFNDFLSKPEEIRVRTKYRVYLFVYLILVIWYQLIP